MATQAQLQGGPFNDDRFHVIPLYRDLRIEDWNILTSAANRLHVRDLRVKHWGILTNLAANRVPVTEQYDEGEDGALIVYEVERNCSNDDGDADIYIQEAVKKLLQQLDSYGLFTKDDADEFSYLIEKAKKDFEFYDHLRQPGLIQHDSSTEKVIEMLSFEWAEWFSFSDVCGLVEDYISVLKKERDTDLYYQYRLFLADCPSLEGDTRISCILAKLKKCDSFMKNGYDSIPVSDLEDGLQYFIRYLLNCQKMGQGNDAEGSYKEKVLKMRALEKSCCEKSRKRFPEVFTDPIHFLAFRAREEAYVIQHPVLEIAKVRAYFNHVVITMADQLLAELSIPYE